MVAPEGNYVMTREFPALAPNKVIDALGALDRRLNKAVDASLRSRLRELRQTPDGGFEFVARDAVGPFAGRTLLFVHGTFSNAENMLNEFKLGPRALRFLNRATRGATSRTTSSTCCPCTASRRSGRPSCAPMRVGG